MSDGPLIVLQQWAKEGTNKLTQEVSFSADGASLICGDVTLSATEKVSVTHDDKTFEYSLGSLYLQIVDPSQSLVKYRGACKKHNVTDPVKASDKATVVGFFLGEDAMATAVAEAAPEKESEAPADAAAAAPESIKAEKASSSSHHRHHHHKGHEKDKQRSKDKHRSSSTSGGKDKHHHHRSHRTSGESSSKRPRPSHHAEKTERKAHKPIDPQMLFTNLVTVVDKRSQKDREQNQILVQALSPEGFSVTPELLEKYKDTTQIITSQEIPVGDSASILKAAAGKDLSRVLKLYMETIQPPKKGSGGAAGGTSAVASSGTGGPSGQKKSWRPYLVGKKPVIILPKGMTAPLTMVNAYEFFGNSKYVPRDVLMKQGAVSKTNMKSTFSRRVGQRLGGGVVEYELMDNPKVKLPSSKDWDRVVAVVALGQSWQFKDWPGHYSNPVKLFESVFGFYVGMEGDKVPPELMGWSVVQSKLNRDKRGLDSVTYASFWNGLDEFMAIHKPELLPQVEA